MYWTVKFHVGYVWVEVGFWRDREGIAHAWTYRTRDAAIASINILRVKRPGRYKLGRSAVPPPTNPGCQP